MHPVIFFKNKDFWKQKRTRLHYDWRQMDNQQFTTVKAGC